MQSVAKEHAPSSGEFFRLLSRMLNYAHHYGTAIQGVNKLLEVELNWLLKVRVSVIEYPGEHPKLACICSG